MHYTVEHLDGDNAMRMRLPLLEENFVIVSTTGGQITPSREQMMIVLKDLRAIYVRAGYWKRTREAKFDFIFEYVQVYVELYSILTFLFTSDSPILESKLEQRIMFIPLPKTELSPSNNANVHRIISGFHAKNVRMVISVHQLDLMAVIVFRVSATAILTRAILCLEFVRAVGITQLAIIVNYAKQDIMEMLK